MAYGILKVDSITFTNGGSDQTVTVSGIVQSISGNITATGTIQGATIIGTSTVSGATVTGDSGQYGNLTAISGVYTTQLSGTTITGDTIQASTVTGISGVYTTQLSGTTITGDTGNYSELTAISGVFTTQISGVTITGDIGQYTTLTGISGVFTTAISGAMITGDAGNYSNLTAISGVFTTQISGTTVTGDTGSFATVTGGVATITSGVFALGTNSLPSISFSSDPNTGIYSPGADQVALSTSGTGRLFVNANGNVGVNTATLGSNAKFEIKSTTGAINSATARLNSSDTTTGAIDTGSTLLFSGHDGSVSGRDYASIFGAKENSTVGNYASYLAFGTRANGGAVSEKLRIDSSGRLLVGTSSLLFNNTDALIQTASSFGSNIVAGRKNQPTIAGQAIGATRFYSYNGSAYQESASIVCSSDDAHTVDDVPGRLAFSVTEDGDPSPTERMRITQAGTSRFYGNVETAYFGTAQTSADPAAVIVVRHSATSTITGTDCLYIFPNGDVKNTTGVYTTISSDERFKQDIVELGSQWDDIKGISLKKFRYKNDPTGELQLGVIAQELQQVCPGLVTTRAATEEDVDASGGLVAEGDEVLGWKMSILPLKAVKALQEAMERIETLEAKVAALESA